MTDVFDVLTGFRHWTVKCSLSSDKLGLPESLGNVNHRWPTNSQTAAGHHIKERVYIYILYIASTALHSHAENAETLSTCKPWINMFFIFTHRQQLCWSFKGRNIKPQPSVGWVRWVLQVRMRFYHAHGFPESDSVHTFSSKTYCMVGD